MYAEIVNLLQHLSDCDACLSASNCPPYRRLAGRLANRQSKSAIALPVHLTGDVIEEYCFQRLPNSVAEWCRAHIGECEPCRRRVEAHALTIAVIRSAFQRLEAPMAPQFGGSDLLEARSKLPISKVAATRCIAALQQRDSSLSEIEAIAKEDPAIAGHLLKVANSALLGAAREVRSIAGAILRLGFERTKTHIWGLSAKALFGSPWLREVWNHSITTAQIARDLAVASQVVDAEEACLTGLVHDIGQLVLSGLGRSYETSAARFRNRGMYAVEIEKGLCGFTHAEIGADLLDSWSFPADMVEAVRHHHTPSRSDLDLTSLLYVAESWVEAAEDVFDPAEHEAAMRRLQIGDGDLVRIAKQSAPDLEFLRIAS